MTCRKMTEEQFNKEFRYKVTTKYFGNRRRNGVPFNPYIAKTEERAILRKKGYQL